jgi:hypothetical protein
MSVLNDLKKSCNAYLYIFISPKANISDNIMAKRKKQLQDLQAIVSLPLTPTLDECFAAIREGITEKYNRTPEQVLSIIYYSNAGKGVSGVGTVTGSHFDGTNWVDDSTGAVLSEDEQVLNTQSADDTSNGGSSTFWSDCASVITWIVNLLKSLGLTKNTSNHETYIPIKNDWTSLPSSPTTSGFTGVLPYLVVGSIVVAAMSGTNKKKAKQK